MSEYNLTRFLDAQLRDYQIALAEIRAGCKQSHWMWYIFPQLTALGRSPTAVYYGIADLSEAKAYIAEPTLRTNLIEITRALLALDETDPERVMGYPDNLKLRSCMTLFELAAPELPEFAAVLDKFYSGRRDMRTISIVNKSQSTP